MSNPGAKAPPMRTVQLETVPTAEDRTRGLLTVAVGADTGRVYRLPAPGTVSLGRSPECGISFDDASVSGTHAQISWIAGRFIFADPGSTNGSYINGIRVSEPRALDDGDRVQLGSSTHLRFSLATAQEEDSLRRVYDAALRDGLTGVFNRKHLEERLEMEISFAKRHGSEVALVMLDVDYFKKVNDTLGHPAGDAVLKHTARVLAQSIRQEDLVGRYGGEEFAIALRGNDARSGVQLAERIRELIQNTPIVFEGHTIRVTASFGVASLACLGDEKLLPRLVALADSRLYQAKESGRNRVVGV